MTRRRGSMTGRRACRTRRRRRASTTRQGYEKSRSASGNNRRRDAADPGGVPPVTAPDQPDQLARGCFLAIDRGVHRAAQLMLDVSHLSPLPA